MPKIKKGKVVTVTSMKGGVGKTVTVLNLAAAYVDNKKKILLIDLDLYNGDIAFALNVDVKGTIFNLSDDVANNRFKSEDDNAYIFKYNEYIDVLAAPNDPRQATKINQKYIEIILNTYVYKYDVILIDTSHILSSINMVAFDCSDTIVTLFSNDSFDLKSTKTFISICKNIDINNLLLVLNTSLDERKAYFSAYDIKNIIKGNIDYIIPSSFYIDNFDGHIIDNNVLDACLKNMKKSKKEYNTFSNLALKLLNDRESEEDIKNEKE